LSLYLKGHVYDSVRGLNISGYKMVLVKTWPSCSGVKCGTASKEIATAHTDEKGDYSITFDYKLKDGESYYLSEQYYGFPYYPEYLQKTVINPGTINRVDINAWRPIELKVNDEVLNNTNGPLHLRNEIISINKSLRATEFIYEQNITKTFYLRSKPNSDTKIIFWYYTGSNSFPILHEKTFLYRTTLDDLQTLNYNIDCSTF
jgi:hypothetical protein